MKKTGKCTYFITLVVLSTPETELHWQFKFHKCKLYVYRI